MRIKIRQLGFVALCAILLGPSVRAEESHVAGIVAEVKDAVAKLRAADPEAVPMAIWKVLAETGVENYVVSANVEELVRNFAPTLGIPRDRVRAARVEIEGGRQTTRIAYPIPFGEGKVDTVREMVRARPHGVAIAGFGNSYKTDAPFLKYIVLQRLPGDARPVAMMINGGAERPEYKGLFRLVTQCETAGGK